MRRADPARRPWRPALVLRSPVLVAAILGSLAVASRSGSGGPMTRIEERLVLRKAERAPFRSGPERRIETLRDTPQSRFLGRGWNSRAYLSADGRTVRKVINRHLGGTQPLTRAARIELAERTVAGIDLLRAEGFPIPAAWVIKGEPVLEQDFASEGVEFDRLSPTVRRRALGEIATMWRRADKTLDRHRKLGVSLDVNVDNFRFADSGAIISWFDPVAPFPARTKLGLRAQRLLLRHAGQTGASATKLGRLIRRLLAGQRPWRAVPR